MKRKFAQMKFGRPYKVYIMPRKRRKISRWVSAIFIISALTYVIFATLSRFSPTVAKVSLKLLEANATRIINTAVTESIGDGINYESLVTITYSPSGTITAITADTNELNRLKSSLTLNILSKLEDLGSQGFSVPLGNLTDILLFSGVGPKIPFRIVPYGSATVDFRNSFTSAGINQTRHEIYIDITADVHAISSVSAIRATISTSVMAAQTVIVGETPSFLPGQIMNKQ